MRRCCFGRARERVWKREKLKNKNSLLGLSPFSPLFSLTLFLSYFSPPLSQPTYNTNLTTQASAPSTRRARRSPTTSRTRSTSPCSPGCRAAPTTTRSPASRARCTRPRAPSSSRTRSRCCPTPRRSLTVRSFFFRERKRLRARERKRRRWSIFKKKNERKAHSSFKKKLKKKKNRPEEARPHARLRRHRQPHRPRRPAPGRRRRLPRRARAGAFWGNLFWGDILLLFFASRGFLRERN